MSESIQYWATTNAGNANSDPAISSSDTQAPNTVATNIRSIMAALAKYHLDANGGLTAGGSANALTVTTNQVLVSAQLTGGLAIMVKAASANTSASVTFAPDGLTAAAVKRSDGSALAIGSIQANQFLFLVYNSSTSEWWCLNIAPNTSVLGSAQASFSANKNSGDQSGIPSATQTKITFGTTVFNTGSYYSTVNSRWTPPAGTIILTAALYWTAGLVDNGTGQTSIYKNGTLFRYSNYPQTGVFGQSTPISIIDTPNGTDYYEIFGLLDGAGTKTISGASGVTWFSGSMI